MAPNVDFDASVKVKSVAGGAVRIGELARRAGVSTRALRYYEEQGLLRPRRQANGYRAYSEGDVDLVRRIRVLLAAGLNSEMAREVLPCSTDDGQVVAPACGELVTELVKERDRITGRIDELQSARSSLEAIIEAGQAAVSQPSGTT
ncbi:MerR family transcriptional regulator [Nocardiopsis oceani]